MQTDNSPLDLKPFARRIRLLRAWRLAGIGGIIGAAVSVLIAIADFLGLRFVEMWTLAVPVGLGMVGGIAYAWNEKISAETIARSVDRRADLSDRLTTATAFATSDLPLAHAVADDAAHSATTVRARQLYPLRLGRLQLSTAFLTVVAIVVFLLGNTTWLKSAQAKRESAALKKAGQEVERVSKPVLEAAKEKEATADDKELAKRLQQFSQELKRSRLTKPEALVKANELAEQAKKLEEQRNKKANDTLQQAQNALNQLKTSGSKLEKMNEKGTLQKMDPNSAESLDAQSKQTAKEMEQTQSEMSKTQSEIQKLQQALKENKDPKTGKPLDAKQSEAMRKKLEELSKKLQELTKRLADLKLSKEAQETFRKLMETPEFKEAQRLMQKIAEQRAAQQQNAATPPGGQKVPELSKEQMEALEKAVREKVKKLEELAKQLKDPAKMKAYAEALLAAAKAGQMCQGGGVGMGIAGAFGLPGMGTMGMPHYGGGAPGNKWDKWGGPGAKLLTADKNNFVKSPTYEDKQITSQIGDKGPETYIEVLGPAQMGKPTSVPYQSALPKYEKSAESALNKGEIPARLRGKVRNYFDALRK